MSLVNVLSAPWAIQPAKLQEIQDIYAAHLRGGKIDVAAVERILGRPLANEHKGFEIRDGVAVLPVEGVLGKKMNLFMEISGGVSMELLARDLREALDNAAVHSIILAIDSPGGTVDGTQAMAQAVRAAREVKPVVALASGAMASAAYWIGSAAGKVYVADGTSVVGSIGVVATHVDVSRAEDLKGVKTTEVVAGAYKRLASQYAPLSDAGRSSIQQQVDYFYSVFVNAVAGNRGVSERQVLRDMADGRIFIGQQAIAAGLVDGMATLDALITRMNQDRTAVAAGGASAFRALPRKPQTRAEVDALAKAYMQAYPGTEYVAAVIRVQDDPESPPVQATPGAAVMPVMVRALLDAKAKAHMRAHPGTDYVAAVKHVQRGA